VSTFYARVNVDLAARHQHHHRMIGEICSALPPPPSSPTMTWWPRPNLSRSPISHWIWVSRQLEGGLAISPAGVSRS
jgi:hypothetical protein